jgi:hypothetical protein
MISASVPRNRLSADVVIAGMKTRSLFLCCLIAAGTAATTQAQIDVNLSAEIRIGRALPPPPPEVIIVEQVGPPGPPPWAPAHGRRGHDYYYYPGRDVYFRPADRTWFYLESGNWRFGAHLPTTIGVDFGRAVSVQLDTDRPYLQHEKVVAYYPPNYFSKVKIKGGKDSQPDGGNGDKPGKGQDKNKNK